MKELRSSMEFIRETAGNVIDRIQERLEDLELPHERFSVLAELNHCREAIARPETGVRDRRPVPADDLIR